ncbi:MAG: phage shock protein [Candidatus Parcubacteria bacterium]|jgi:phage shock protein C|nr:phage shock protein [Candidatus Parcubacteria bacterium]
MEKKLYRSREHRVVSGVLGGLGEYFTIDPVIVRLLFIIVTLATGFFPGLIAYVVAVYIVPEVPFIVHSAPISAEGDDTPAV